MTMTVAPLCLQAAMVSLLAVDKTGTLLGVPSRPVIFFKKMWTVLGGNPFGAGREMAVILV